MRQDLIQKGVPKENIVCDFAGFRTLDSIIRAQKMFGLQECLIISQHLHNELALYLADSIQMKAVTFDAADPPDGIEARLWWRERFSRLTAVLDVNVWKMQPRYLGPPIAIGPHREDQL
jgi:vancomycin permeability regulator SanA